MKYFCFILCFFAFSCATSPREKGYAVSLAQQYYLTGESKQALDLYNTFYSFGGLDKADLHNYLVLLLNTKRFSEVVKIIEDNGLVLQGRIAKYYGYALYGLEDVDKAFDVLGKAYRADPGDVKLAVRYSQMLEASERSDDAQAVLLEAVNTGDVSIAVLLLERKILEGWDIDMFSFTECDSEMVDALVLNDLNEQLRLVRESDIKGAASLCKYFVLAEDWDKAEYWFDQNLELGERDIVELGQLLSIIPEDRRTNFYLLLKEYFGAPFFL